MADALTEQFLMPLVTLEEFIGHAEANGPAVGRAVLQDAWRHARLAMARLAEREAGCADEAAVLPLPEAMAPQAAALAAHPAMARAFDTVPVAFGLVEVDALMASRASLWSDRLTAAESLAEGAREDDTRLAAACLDAGLPRPPLQTQCLGDTWTVLADDPLLQARPQRVATADHGQLQWCWQAGSPPPVVHVARHAGRLLLVDGHHRARVLRLQGVTFLPCVVSACEDLDDVALVAPHLARADLARWFDATRPPLLRDHDRPSLVHRHAARRPRRLLQLRMGIQAQPLG